MKEILDFSTSVMWRNLKLIHMWTNFSFLHMFHVQNFEISPHDRFFLHGPGPLAHDKMLQLNLPTNIYKSSNNKSYQQKTTNLPTIKLNQQKSTNLPTIIYKSSNNKTVPTEIYKSPNKYLQIFQQ